MKVALSRISFAMLALAILGASTVAVAQRPGGGNRGGPGGFGFGGGGFGGATVGLLLRDSTAEELQLTDEQKQKIREINDKLREDSRVRDLFSKMREASEEERTLLQAELNAALADQRKQSDADVQKVLSTEQFTRYRQLALQSRGVSALSDSDVAEELKLTPEQLAKLKDVAAEMEKKRNDLMTSMRENGFRGGGEDFRAKFDALRKEGEEKRLSVLTDAQREQWTTLKGPEPASANSSSSGTQNATVVRRTSPTPDAQAVLSETFGDPSSQKPVVSFGKAADEFVAAKTAMLAADTSSSAPAKTNAAEPAKPEKVSFNFRHAAWADVLKKFAELAGLTLDLNVVPPGTFNYLDDKEYTPTEALDVLNGYLLQKGYILVRRDSFLVVLNIDDGIPPNLVPHVTVDELPKRGKNELMNLIIPIENITADEAAAEAEQLKGPQGTVVALKRANAISVTDIGSNLQRIHRLLVGLNAAPTDVTFKSYELQHIDAHEAEDKVRAIFGLQRGVESVAEGTRSRSYGSYDGRSSSEYRDRDGRPIAPPTTATKSKVQVSSDERTNRLLVTATAPELKIIDELLKTIDVEDIPGTTRRPRSREPYLVVYQLKTADAQEVAKTLNVLHPGCVVNEDGRARRIHVYATPTQHDQIERMVRQLDGEGGGGLSVAVVSTGRIDSLTAVATLQSLYATERETAPSITPHPTGYGLIVRGSPQQVDQIKVLLSQMDPDALRGEPQKGNLRTIPLGGRDPEEFSRMLQQFWGARKSNPIIVVPSDSRPVRDMRIPTATPSANDRAPVQDQQEARPARSTRRTQVEETSAPPRNSQPKRSKVAAPPATTQPRAQASEPRIITVGLQEAAHEKSAESAETPRNAKARKKNKAQIKAKKSAAQTQSTAPATTESPAQRTPNEAPPQSEKGTGDPILLVPSGGNLILRSNDETALDELEQLIELMQQATPAKPRWTIFYLRSADATDAAAMLERLFPTSSVSSSVGASSSMFGELTSGISSMGRSLMNATGLSSINTGALTLRIIPDARSNALYVAGPPDQVREVEMMLQVLDASELPEQLRERAPRRIEVQYADVDEVAAIIRDVYKDDMAPEGGQQGQPNPFQMFMGGGSSRGGNNNSRGGQARTIKLTLGVDNRTNALIVSASEPLFRQIEALVFSLDDAARDANHTVRVVDLKGSNSAAVQSALSAMYSKIKIASSGSSSRSSSSSSRSSSSSSGSSSGGGPPSFGGSPFGGPPFGGIPFGVSPFGGGSSFGGGSDDFRRMIESRMRERFGGGSSSGR
jgi:type II secretory pathway component GspD/PulD (secretin)/Spy/CpxP family protein refolding chaperone